MSNDNQHIQEILMEASGKSSIDERNAFLDEMCRNNKSLRNEVESLLKALDKSDDFLDSPVIEADVTLEVEQIERTGSMVGRFKILEKIGEGGMASVFMAEQKEPIRRKAALKVIKLGMDTKQVIARFEAERQALALMDHPNIAKVYDAGATENGRPYFVMELVRGVSITEYCDKNNLSTQERLKLFIPVCQAIQHAHQKGIIHRDIKPSNVMVTLHDGKPVPKVIDFGIAKATNQQLTEKTMFTKYAQLIGTPEYMSPEQAEMSGLDIDTRSDIYSLGVLLYELLTGTTPIDGKMLRSKGYAEMQRMIREEEPTKPSTKISALGDTQTIVAKQRNTTPESLKRSVRGDLDWIVLKTLEKDRIRRYETAHSLSLDIQRHLEHKPILAGSPGALYRLHKYVHRNKTKIAVISIIVVLLAGIIVTSFMYRQSANLQWAQGEALPIFVKLVKDRDYQAAYSMAQKIRTYIPDDPTIMELLPGIRTEFTIKTTPEKASVSYRDYASPDESWQYLGESPLSNVILPKGMYRWKIEKIGFDTHECVANRLVDVRLRQTHQTDDMVWMAAWPVEIFTDGQANSIVVNAPQYLIDKFEVTNEQFKTFMDRGGYTNPEYWIGMEFIKDQHRLTWTEAIAEFQDQSGTVGPSTWRDGRYPAEKGRHPVAGVSWFEANAYANYAGKSLPTIHHWQKAACVAESLAITPFSNFSLKETAPVGEYFGMGHTGLYDMAGNVKEWCLNKSDRSTDLRYILGGSWAEPTYMFTAMDSRSPWNRSPDNGFRCVRYPSTETPLPDALFDTLEQYYSRDYSALVSFSDDEFKNMKAQFLYDPMPLNAEIESIDNSMVFCRKEKITFDAAYNGERMIAYLFLPKDKKPSYQTVIFFPGVSAVYTETFEGLPDRDLTEFIITSGRALMFPIYKGTYERPMACGRIWSPTSVARNPMTYRDWIVLMGKDLRRCVDYLETRNDIDSNRIAFYAESLGSTLGPIMLSIEDRIRTGILTLGGIPQIDLPRSIDIALYTERVKAPVLMVNGKEDFFLPLMTAQKPMYDLLGTPEEDKAHMLYPGGHGVFGLFFDQIRDDVLKWLDRYLGEVR